MTEHLREDLRALADRAQVPPVDVPALEAAAADRRGRRNRRRAGLAGAAVVLLAGVGFAATWSPHRDDLLVGSPASPSAAAQPCLPAPATASPVVLRPGGSVTLSAPAFTCTAYQPGKTYAVVLDITTDNAPGIYEADLGRLPVNTDGSFQGTVRLPADVPTGQGTFYLRGNSYDLCGDRPTDYGSCPGYKANPTVTIRSD